MGNYKLPGPICNILNFYDIDTGTLCINASPIPGPIGEKHRKASKKKHSSHKKHHTHILLKPNMEIMSKINFELNTKINFDKLADFEGGQLLTGYIPGHTVGKLFDVKKVAGQSGVTIGTGFDIGQWSISDLKLKLGLSLALQDKYKRFCKKKKQAAIDELEKNGALTVTKFEADESDMKVQRFHLIAAIAVWDEDPKPTQKFTELTPAQQTIILSRTYHQGTGMPYTDLAEDFYQAAQAGNWVAAEKALRNYNVSANWYKTRVKQEADFLASDLRNQKSNPR